MRKKIYNTIKKYLEDSDFKYNVDDDDVFRMGVHGENTNMNVVVLADDSYPRIIKVLFQDDMEGSRPDNDNPELTAKHSQLCS